MTSRRRLSVLDMNNQKITTLADGTATTDAATKQQVDAAAAFGASLANRGSTTTDHTAINDFDTQVRVSTLNQMAAPTADLSINSHKLTGVTDPTNPQEAATKAYVDAQLAGLATGLTLKGSVRAAVSTNVNIASPGTTLDGLTAANGDIFLLTGQTTGSQNGPYVYNGSAVAMTRATNWDASAEAVLGSYWSIREGTQADKFALMTNDSAITLGTTTPTFTFFSAAAGTSSYMENCPVTSAGGTWTVTHSLGTRDVLVVVYRNSSPWDEVDVDVERTSTTAVSIKPDVALASAEYRVIVKVA